MSYRYAANQPSTLEKFLGAAFTVSVLAALMLVVFAVFSAVPVLLAWNLGVHGVAGAVGAHVGTINIVTAFGLAFVVALLSRLFSNGDSATVER